MAVSHKALRIAVGISPYWSWRLVQLAESICDRVFIFYCIALNMADNIVVAVEETGRDCRLDSAGSRQLT